ARKVCTNVELVQKEPCMGPVPVCSSGHLAGNSAACVGPMPCTEMEVIEPNCGVTNWSEWSPCSKTCGKGYKIRTRLYLNPYKSKNMCKVKLIQSIECVAEQCPMHRNDAR